MNNIPIEIPQKQHGRVLVYAGSGLGNIVLATPVVNTYSKMGWTVDFILGLPAPLPGITSLFKLPSVRRVITPTTEPPDKYYGHIYHTRWYHPSYFTGEALKRYYSGNIYADHRHFVDTVDYHHEIHNNLLALTNLNNADGYDFTPTINFDPNKKFLTKKKVIGIHAGGKFEGNWISKRWDKYELLISELHKIGYTVALFGAGMDDKFSNVDLSFFNALNIYDAAGWINACDYFISNDTGLMHMAAAMKKKQVGIFCGIGFARFQKNDPRDYNPNCRVILRRHTSMIMVDDVLRELEVLENA